jgi:hypothetical protein
MSNEPSSDESEEDDDDDNGEEEKEEKPWYKDDKEDDNDEKEPKSTEIEKEIPNDDNDDNDDEISVPKPSKTKSTLRLLFSPSTGEYYIDKGETKVKVPLKYTNIASNKSMNSTERAMKIMNKMQSDTELEDDNLY